MKIGVQRRMLSIVSLGSLGFDQVIMNRCPYHSEFLCLVLLSI